jgi:N-acetylmuramoyl-L-alanine amidase
MEKGPRSCAVAVVVDVATSWWGQPEWYLGRISMSVALPLGVALVDALVEATGLYRRGMFVRPELSVLRKTEMPAVLVELGFVSNPAEAALLSTRPNLFAEALYTGILNYFASRS